MATKEFWEQAARENGITDMATLEKVREQAVKDLNEEFSQRIIRFERRFSNHDLHYNNVNFSKRLTKQEYPVVLPGMRDPMDRRRTLRVLVLLAGVYLAIGCGVTGTTNTESVGTNSAPTVTLTASPTTIVLGQSTTITVVTANASTCTGSGTLVTPGPIQCNTTFTNTVVPTTVGSFTYQVAVSGSGSSSTASVTVTVNPPPPTVTAVNVSCSPPSITTIQTTTCAATVTGTNNPSSTVIWSIGPTTVGAISATGVFTPAAAGVETIIARSVQDPTQSGSATVTVSLPVTISGVTVTCSPTSILTTQTATCIPNATGTGNYNSAVSWSVSPSSIGSVSNAGVFSPASSGTATITATSTEDPTKSGDATVAVAVPITITGVTVTCSPTLILTTQTSTCTPNVTGTGNFSGAVSWSTGASGIGSVSSAGVFTPTSSGTATITATSTQDGTKSGNATVTVAVPITITGVFVTCYPLSILMTQTTACTPIVTGTGTYSNAVSWTVSPSSIGSVSSAGVFSPTSSGTATITATSTQDGTKAGSATLAVTTQVGVSISPAVAQVQVFQPQQFTATVGGSSSTAVTWAVNGIPGGNLSVGQIDSTGYYFAPNALPSPSAITITATSQTDATQSATASVTILPDAHPPAIASVTPAADQIGVALDSTIQIQFTGAIDPSTISSSTFALSSGNNPIPSAASYDSSSNTVTMTPASILAPGAQYSVTIGNAVSDPAGTPLSASAQWSFTTQVISSANCVVSAPTGTDPTTLTVVSYGGQESVPDGQGNCVASVTPLGSTLVAAMVPGRTFGWLAFAGEQTQGTNAHAVARAQDTLSTQTVGLKHNPVSITRYQITASPHANPSTTSITIDSQTTAEALLFMTPYFYNSAPNSASVIQAAIAADPNTTLLAQALEEAQGEADPLNDTNVRSVLQSAALSVLQTLVSNASSAASPIASQLMSINGAANSQPSPVLESLATPNCWVAPPGILNGMQCLDLQYLEFVAPLRTDSSGNFDVTVNNCWFTQANTFNLGCSTSWLLEVAPITTSLPGGVNSVVAPVGSGGQSASPVTDFDPGCTLGTPSSSCTFIWIPGMSGFNDAGADVSLLVETALGLRQYAPSSSVTTPNVVTIPGGTQQNYIVRAYSGGFADLTEYANILNGDYNTDSLELVANALVMNALQSGLHYTSALIPVPSGASGIKQQIMACVVLDAVNNHDIVNEISIVQSAIRANNGVSIGTLQQLFEATANDLVNIEFKYVISCAASIGLDPVQELYSGLTDEIHLFLNDPKSALASNIDAVIQGAASIAAGTTTDLGEGTQGLVELIHTATPLETAIISVTNAGQAAPQVTGIVNDPVIGLDGKQKVIIQGYGFANGATINWQDVTGGGSGTAITADGSVTATTITAYMNFTNQSATWRIQVVNPNVPPSNWFSFQVTANTTAKPDLVPQSITLNSSSVLAGGTVAITFTVLNQGTGPAAASMTGFRLGTSNTVPPGSSADIPNSLISTPALGAGLPVQQSQSLTIPSATGAGTYYIWVVVDDVAGSTLGQSNTNNDYASSPVLAVTVGQTPVPTPQSPGTTSDTGYTVSTATPTMQWFGSGATSYELAISEAPYGTSNVVYDKVAVPGTSSLLVIPAGQLKDGTKYRWNMQASNSAGLSVWSSYLYFTVDLTAVPPAPTPVSPGTGTSPGSTLTTLVPTFSWSTVTGATGYGLYVEDVASGVLVYNNDAVGNITSFAMPSGTLVAAHSYVWNVQASNTSGFSAYSTRYYFVEPGTASTGQFQVGTRIAAQSGGANVRNAQLASTPLFAQEGGVHGTIASGPIYGTAGGYTGNWWAISWDSEPPSQNSQIGWSAESTITLAPTAGDVPKPNFSSSYYASANPFWNSGYAPVSTNPPGTNHLNGALGNCTWYTYGRMLELGASPTQIGVLTMDADQWAAVAGSNGIPVDTNPTVHSIAERDSDPQNFPAGHVAVVESVNADGTITVTESSSGLITTGNWMFLWRHRTVSPGWFSHFIHISLSGGSSAPAVPTSLSPGTSTSPGPTTPSTTVTLSWSGTSGATYEVAVKDVAAGTYIDDTTVSSTTFTASNLSPGKQYVWNVDACNGSACSNFAPAIYFRTP